MKILATGDWQIEDGPTMDHVDDNGRSIRLQETVEGIKAVLDIAKAENCRTMVHLGDLTEHSNPKSTESDAAADCCAYWMEDGRDILAAVGNHDGKIFGISSSSFAPLARMASKNFSAPHVPSYRYMPGADVYLVVLPYLHNKTPQEVKEALGKVIAQLDPGIKAYLFMHYGYVESAVGAKNLVMPGDKLSAGELFPERFELIVAGHVHKQQVMYINAGGRRIAVIHPGSLDYVDFGERNDNKGYVIIDLKTGKWDLRQVTPKRTWVQAQWPIDWPPINAAPWKAGDIVKIVGEHPAGANARGELEELYKQGLPRPFALSWAVTPARAARVDRGSDLAQANSLHDAAIELGRKLFPDSPYLEGALALVAD